MTSNIAKRRHIDEIPLIPTEDDCDDDDTARLSTSTLSVSSRPRSQSVRRPNKRKRIENPFANVSHDLLGIIAQYFDAHDMYAALFVNRQMNAFISPDASSSPLIDHVWRRATTALVRSQLDKHPKLIPWLRCSSASSCPLIVHLMSNVGCQFCGKQRIRKIYVPFFIRACEQCMEQRTISEAALKLRYGLTAEQVQTLPYYVVETWTGAHSPYSSTRTYLMENVEAVIGGHIAEKIQQENVLLQHAAAIKQDKHVARFPRLLQLVQQHPSITNWQITVAPEKLMAEFTKLNLPYLHNDTAENSQAEKMSVGKAANAYVRKFAIDQVMTELKGHIQDWCNSPKRFHYSNETEVDCNKIDKRVLMSCTAFSDFIKNRPDNADRLIREYQSAIQSRIEEKQDKAKFKAEFPATMAKLTHMVHRLEAHREQQVRHLTCSHCTNSQRTFDAQGLKMHCRAKHNIF